MTHMYFSARAEGRISYGHLGRTNSCLCYNRTVPRHIEHATPSLSWSEMLDFIPLTLWPLNSPDLNPVKYCIWSVLEEKVYHSRITDLEELKTRLIDEWAQSIVDVAVGQCAVV